MNRRGFLGFLGGAVAVIPLVKLGNRPRDLPAVAMKERYPPVSLPFMQSATTASTGTAYTITTMPDYELLVPDRVGRVWFYRVDKI